MCYKNKDFHGIPLNKTNYSVENKYGYGKFKIRIILKFIYFQVSKLLEYTLKYVSVFLYLPADRRLS